MGAWYKRWKPIELNKFVELVSLLKIMTIEMKRDKWKKDTYSCEINFMLLHMLSNIQENGFSVRISKFLH